MSRKIFLSSALALSITALTPAYAQAETTTDAAEMADAAEMTAALDKSEEGSPIYSADGRKIGAIYRVYEDGRVGVIVRGQMLIVPAETISTADGRHQTSLSYRELMKMR